LIKRHPEESHWRGIPWATSLGEARRQAAAEGKPIVVWTGSGGYEPRLHGVLDDNVRKQAITRCDILALGDLLGLGPKPLARPPGRNPLGFAFELVSGDNPVDRLPPLRYLTKADLARYLR
jgi:hypothetical protein